MHLELEVFPPSDTTPHSTQRPTRNPQTSPATPNPTSWPVGHLRGRGLNSLFLRTRTFSEGGGACLTVITWTQWWWGADVGGSGGRGGSGGGWGWGAVCDGLRPGTDLSGGFSASWLIDFSPSRHFSHPTPPPPFIHPLG